MVDCILSGNILQSLSDRNIASMNTLNNSALVFQLCVSFPNGV
jgi:hypothetical protein